MFNIKKIVISFSLIMITNAPNLVYASPPFHYPFYFGITGGYGATTWNGLVPPKDKQIAAINISMPTDVKEGGFLWGVFIGYEFIPCFALEASYFHYPNAKVKFDPEESLFVFEHNRDHFETQTEMVSIMAKIMLIIPKTNIRAYSSAGVADIHRKDDLTNLWQLSPTFGIGFNYNFSESWMAEIGANYTGGYGESELTPVNDYVPFLYSAFLRFAYRF